MTVRPPAGAPNVVMIVLDDVGFAQLGCFGSDIPTPAFDGLAAGGLRYNRFHVTALCSPTRASILTGRNHHRVGMGFLADLPTNDPGYTARIPPSAGTVARVLRDGGYSTMAVGKWHLTPRSDRTASGPFATWPLGLGFERYYGFLHGDANQWTPTLVSDNHHVEPPRTPAEGYHLGEDLSDAAIDMISSQHNATPDKPFFLYLAPGAAHAPHQAPASWIEAQRGRYDAGWDVQRDETLARQIALGIVPPDAAPTPRPAWVQPWDELSEDEQRFYARTQEVFAAFLSHADACIGRVLDHLDRLGIAEDTLVLACSDNGASAEGGTIGSVNEHRMGFSHQESLAENMAALDAWGGFNTYNHYPWGWAWAGNAPFHLWKRYTWLGGTRTPLIVRWPNGIDAESAGGVRDQLCHAVDVAPTILAAAGLAWPDTIDGVDQMEIDGAPINATFDDADATDPRSTQYFEILGSRSIYHDGWKATTDHVSMGVPDEQRLVTGSRDFATDTWALFRLDEDFAETDDLAAEHPDVVAELAERWDQEAERNHVLPMYDALQTRFGNLAPATWPTPARVELLPGGVPIADEALPLIGLAATRITVLFDAPEDGGSGVLCAQGDWNNGWAIVVDDGVPSVHLSVVGWAGSLMGGERLAPGTHTVTLDLWGVGDDQAQAVLAVDGEVVDSSIEAAFHNSGQIGGGGLCIGYDRGFPVSPAYETPYPWSGTIDRVIIEAPAPDDQAELALALEALRRD